MILITGGCGYVGSHAVARLLELNQDIVVLDNLSNSSKLNNIEEAKFINDRRWNLKLSNQILVLLSEKNIKSSLKNYIKLINQLKESEILLIKSIDLRNQKKAIINFK